MKRVMFFCALFWQPIALLAQLGPDPAPPTASQCDASLPAAPQNITMTVVPAQPSWDGLWFLAVLGVLLYLFYRWTKSLALPGGRAIVLTPGTRLLQWAEFFCTRKFYEHTVKPLVADMQCEYFAALNEGRRWKPRWVCVLYYAIWFYLILLAPISRFWDTIRRIGFSG